MATIEKTATYEPPGRPGSPVELKDRYENFIGGAWTAPKSGEYRENLSPATGEPFCEIAYSTPDDIDLALDAAHADGPRHPGGQGVDELLPPLPGPRRVRRVQELGRRARDPQDDARPLHADQVPARQL